MQKTSANQPYQQTGDFIRSLSYVKLAGYCEPNKDLPIHKYVLVANLLRDPILYASRILSPFTTKMAAAGKQELEQQWFDNCIDDLDHEQELHEVQKQLVHDHCERTDYDKKRLSPMPDNDAQALRSTLMPEVKLKTAGESYRVGRNGSDADSLKSVFDGDLDNKNDSSYGLTASPSLYSSFKLNTFRNGCRFLMCSSI